MDITLIRGDTLALCIDRIEMIVDGESTDYILTDTDRLIMDVKKHYNGDIIIHKEMTAADYVDTNILFAITPQDTEYLTVGEYVYDIRLVQDDEHVYTIIPYSKFIILKNVTEV